MTGNYHLPALYLPAEKERHMGAETCKVFEAKQQGFVYEPYYKLSRLNEYLANVDALAEDMFFRLVAEYADRRSVTEQLKSENQFLWIQT